MAYEVPLFTPGGLVSGANLSVAAKQFTAVIMNTTNNTIVGAGAGVQALGIIQNTPVIGEEASVMMAGVSKVVAGTGGLTAGDKWTPEADGDAVAAAIGDRICGTVLQGASAGGIATVTIGLESIIAP